MKLNHEPFSYCVIDDFLLDRNVDQFCKQLTNELRNMKYNQKNNDLYKFQQVQKKKIKINLELDYFVFFSI